MRSISHELRTPVNGSLNYLEAALNDESIDQLIKEKYIIPCLFCVKIQLSVINDILDYF